MRGTGYSLALAGGGLALRLDEAGVAGVLTSRPTNAVGTRAIFETYNTRSPDAQPLAARTTASSSGSPSAGAIRASA